MRNAERFFTLLFSGTYSGSLLVLVILAIVAQWRIFTKAGEHGWATLVPFYSSYVLFRITWGNGAFFLLLLIPVVNIIISILTYIKLAYAFGKSNSFAVGLIFLPSIFLLILGLGDAEYLGVPN